MDWSLAVAQAVIIAALSALISYLVSKRQKNLDFNYDYRKYILEKRKEAYEKVERVISGFQMIHFDEKRIAPKFYDATKGNSFPLGEYNNQVLEALRNSIWLGTDIFFRLQDLNDKLLEQIKELEQIEDVKEGLINIGSRDRHEMMNFYVTLTNIYFKDIITLDDIDAFKANKKEMNELFTTAYS